MRFVQAGVMLLGAAIYVFVIVVFLQLTPDTLWVVLAAIIGWNVLLIVATILAIVDSIRKVRAGRTRALATDVFVVKLAAIPFFLINFALLGAVALLGVGLMRIGGFVLLFAVPLEIGLTYLAMISTSVYGWASIARLRRDRVIGTRLAVLYSILLFVFVTDIVAGIMLFGHSRRRPGLALVIVLLTLWAILAVPGYAIADLDLTWLSDIFVLLFLATIVVALIRRARLSRRLDRSGSGEGGLEQLPDGELLGERMQEGP